MSYVHAHQFRRMNRVGTKPSLRDSQPLRRSVASEARAIGGMTAIFAEDERQTEAQCSDLLVCRMRRNVKAFR